MRIIEQEPEHKDDTIAVVIETVETKVSTPIEEEEVITLTKDEAELVIAQLKAASTIIKNKLKK